MILRLTSLSEFRRLVQLSMDDKQRFGLLAGRHVAHQRSVLTNSSQKKRKKDKAYTEKRKVDHRLTSLGVKSSRDHLTTFAVGLKSPVLNLWFLLSDHHLAHRVFPIPSSHLSLQ